MSQPIKSEPVVKTEPGTERIPSASAAAPAIASSRYSADQGWQDIPLKACTEEEIQDIRYHILKFQTKQNVDIVSEFTKPVRLHRKDPRNIQFQLTRQELEQRKKEQEELKREREKLKLENEERIRKAKEEAMIDEGLTEAEREAIANNIGTNGIGLVNPDPPKNATGTGAAGASKNGSDLSQVAPDGGARKPRKNLFKRKTRQINLMDDNKRKLRYEEYYPWVLEDYDGKNVFVGNYEAGSSDTQHVLFVFDKDGFKMVPAEKVYKFTPRNKYATLTLEEAEAKMEKNSSVPRWLMKHMEDQLSVAGGGVAADSRFRHNTASSSSSASFMGPGGVGTSASSSSRSNNGRRLVTVSGGGRSNDRDSDHDDLDFDEEFADDEEAPIMDGDEEENKLSEQKLKKEMLKAAHFDGQSDADIDDDDLDDLFETEKSRKVDKEGEKLRKVLNKTEGGVYESDDDDKLNPYLSKSDLESDDESDEEIKVKQEGDLTIKDLQSQVQAEQQQQQQQQRNIFADNLGDGFVLVRAPTSFLANFPTGEWNPHVNSRKRPSPSPVNSASPKKSKTPTNEEKSKSISPSPAPSAAIDLNSAGPDGVLVTTKEVLDIVRDNPLTTKDLLVGLKNRVNAHRDNKQRIIAIVKHNLKLVDGKLVLKEDI